METPDRLQKSRYSAVYFDLDGTLVDTAPDMVAVLGRIADKHGKPAVPWALARNNVSNGSVGLLKLAFPEATEREMAQLVDEFLADYAENLCIESDVFSPLRDLLDALQVRGNPWGVVTNKPARMTDPLLTALGIGPYAASVVSGDTLQERKPHPAPLLHAATLASLNPGDVVYVGDAPRDIDAGRAAGMATIAVGYGYTEEDDDPQSWGADAYAADTLELIRLIQEALSLPA